MVNFNFIGNWPPKSKPSLIKKVLQSLKLDLPPGEINIKLVDDATITALNKQYSGNAYATDVLSFSYIENRQPTKNDSEDQSELGDIAISLETAQRQADNAGNSISEELALLSVHGLLHIAGYDHQDDEGRDKMEKLQAEALRLNKIKYREFKWQ